MIAPAAGRCHHAAITHLAALALRHHRPLPGITRLQLQPARIVRLKHPHCVRRRNQPRSVEQRPAPRRMLEPRHRQGLRPTVLQCLAPLHQPTLAPQCQLAPVDERRAHRCPDERHAQLIFRRRNLGHFPRQTAQLTVRADWRTEIVAREKSVRQRHIPTAVHHIVEIAAAAHRLVERPGPRRLPIGIPPDDIHAGRPIAVAHNRAAHLRPNRHAAKRVLQHEKLARTLCRPARHWLFALASHARLCTAALAARVRFRRNLFCFSHGFIHFQIFRRS